MTWNVFDSEGGVMAFNILRVNYFKTIVKDQPGEGYKLLSQLENLGVNLLAFTAVPLGSIQTQLRLFPEDSSKLLNEAGRVGLELDGPHPALLVSGDDKLGALARIHEKLYRANVNIFSSSGMTDGRGCFGYIIYVRSDDYERAVAVLKE